MIEEVRKDSIANLLSFFCDNNIPIVDADELDNNPFLNIFVYLKDDKVVGYINYSIIYDKAELNYIFVDSNYRKNGIGSILIKHLLLKCDKCNNITLYKKYGFRECAIRKNYYNGVDGILRMRQRGE